ncbi:tetratricopeptide repeat protein [Thiorhodococcus mannitoliphagus]|uniref:Tetratricopeptide repeat protein n=1 Tax=Thiorhodococcus mannitoliphagus TaxID=329406 RepID=A0A6P1DQN1_9GAMM|nr:tetratricopeptide repeat protein [Thiorhodococcus mannitoliphagus]NEX19241.1 tetratricopeptide repeat protein [Thiorhodococcus mannitoliphagus]
MFHQETADAEHFEQVIVAAVRKILTRPDQDAFLDWARTSIPETLGLMDAHLDLLEVQRLATLLATVIWNATPQPANAFQPVPMDAPAPEAPCSCGSGLSYASCCGNVDDMPELSSELIWEILLDELPEGALREALALDAVPGPLLAKIADRWLDDDRPGRVVALLEPLFAGPLDELNARFEPALDILCDAYDRLDHWRKKRVFLDRVCNEGSRDLQAAAWQRRSTIHIDEGDYAEAESAFTAALRSNPDNPSTALLEITLLAAQHKDWLARERARFWLHKLRRLGYRDEGFMDFLERAVLDPQDAMVSSHADVLDPALVDFTDWMAVIAARPLPHYALAAIKAASKASARVEQPDLFDIDDAGAAANVRGVPKTNPADRPSVGSMMPRGLAVALRPPARSRQSESFWRALYPVGKPVSTQLTLQVGADMWEDSTWVDYLLGHPELADSLDVLDDLATALYEHPESSLPWISHALLRPLLDRAWEILQAALPADDPRFLPWSCKVNRPALRLLFRRYLSQSQEGQHADAIGTLETLLRLNPQDNHGARAELMNHYLRDGEDERAVALAQRFPDDLLADLAYGEVLALYRLGRQDRARSALKTAIRRLPRIPQYLTRKRIKQPRLSPLGVAPGGDDQAWLYREAMLDVWAAEPGILAWLKRCTVR